MTTWNELMNAPPEPRLFMPPAEGGASGDAAAKWQAAISGQAPQFIGLTDTKKAAESWLNQPFTEAPPADEEAPE